VAVCLWFSAESSKARILKYVGCTDMQPKTLWRAFITLREYSYDQLIDTHDHLVRRTDSMEHRRKAGGAVKRHSLQTSTTQVERMVPLRVSNRVKILKKGSHTG
jgi:hypothetical protein